MPTPEQVAIGKLDGRDPASPNYVAEKWTGVSLYKDLDLGQKLVSRPAGADPGKAPGQQWWTPSALDKITVLSEVLTGRYHGQVVFDMIAGLFAVLVEGKPPAEVRTALGLPEPPTA